MLNVSLEEHLESVDNDLASLILKISDIAVSKLRYQLPSIRGKADTKNVFDEFQDALDIWADRLFIEELGELKSVNTIASEERKDQVKLNENGIFYLTSDPIDGSSNIISNNLLATIIGVYKDELPTQGTNQIASLYMLYGPITSLVYTTGNGVHEFFYTKRGFILREKNIRFPKKAKLISPGGLRKDWLPRFRKYIEKLEKEGFKLRYGGSFAGDFHQILHYGGVFAYPALKENPDGKLRLLFESNPIALITKQANGKSSNGEYSILDVKPKSLDQRIPTYVGNDYLIDGLEQALKDRPV